MFRKLAFVALLFAGFLVGARLGAAPAETALAATTAPASAPARHVLTMPPGFSKIEVNQRSAIVEPADQAWVREVLGALQPTTLPSTMPSDLLGSLQVRREAIRTRIVKDLAISDAAIVDKFLSEKMEPALHRFDQISPPLFYLVISQDRLKQLLKDGWSDPRFYYNRAADRVQFSPMINLAADGASDDILLPADYEPAATPQQKTAELRDLVRASETGVAQSISNRAMVVAQVEFVNFIFEQAIAPLKPTRDQEWFGLGLAGVLSARYVAQISEMDPQRLIRVMISDDPRSRFRATAIDLLHPLSEADMRPGAVQAYADAFRRKSARAVQSWIAQAGDEAIPRTLTALKQNPPADGPALLREIKRISGVDLSSDVRAGQTMNEER